MPVPNERLLARLELMDSHMPQGQGVYARIYSDFMQGAYLGGRGNAPNILNTLNNRYVAAGHEPTNSGVAGGVDTSRMTGPERQELAKLVKESARELGLNLSKTQIGEVVSVLDSNAREVMQNGWRVGSQSTIAGGRQSDATRARIETPTSMRPTPPADAAAHGAASGAAEVAGRVGRTALRAVGPIAAVSSIVSYPANQAEAERNLTAMLGKDGVPKLSKDAIAEYGAIVAMSRVEQGITFEVSQAYGFSKFVDWGKKHNLPIEALEKLNPTNKTKAQIEEALTARSGLMAQADAPTVVLAHAPDVRSRDGGRGNGVA